MSSECSLDGCARKVQGKGYCLMHYLRWKRHGDPLKGRRFNGSDVAWLDEYAVSPPDDRCVIWPFKKDPKGYARIGGRDLCHRYVCKKVNGPPPFVGAQAAHTCGNGAAACVSGRHLAWKTQSENEKDKLIHGTHNRGVRHPLSKLTEAQVLEMRANRQISNRTYATRFGVCPATVSRCRNGVDWFWLT